MAGRISWSGMGYFHFCSSFSFFCARCLDHACICILAHKKRKVHTYGTIIRDFVPWIRKVGKIPSEAFSTTAPAQHQTVLPKKPSKFFLKKHFRFIFPLPFCRKVCYNEYIRGLSAEFPPSIAYIIKFSTWRVNTMKKLLAIILAALMLVPMLAACDRSGTQKGDYKVAMITDYGDITDQSFNQTTYEACKEYCDANKIDFQYFKPAGDSTEERVAKVEEAIDGGYNIIVMPGFAFAGTLYQVQDKEEYKDVKFIALDVSEYDLFDCFYSMTKPAQEPVSSTKTTRNTSARTYTAQFIKKNSAAIWQVMQRLSSAIPTSASSAAWQFPLLSATATVSFRAATTQAKQ